MSSEKKPQPVAWVIPGDDNANCNGFIDAMAYQDGEFTRPLYSEATIEALRAERDEALNLAERSTRRLAEFTAPGSIGAFAARDAMKARAETAEARVAQLEKRIFEITEYDMDVCYAHTQLRALLSDGGRENG